MRRKLSAKLIEHLKAPGPKRVDVWDTALQCFGLRVSQSGRKTWFVTVRVDGRQKRVTIGTYPAISLAEARTAAQKTIHRADIHQTYLSGVESGKRNPSVAVLERIATSLDSDISMLFVSPGRAKRPIR